MTEREPRGASGEVAERDAIIFDGGFVVGISLRVRLLSLGIGLLPVNLDALAILRPGER